MTNSTTTSRYSKTFTSFSGADIICTFNGVVIGELQALTYSVTREKGPIYVMGDPNPKSFSRGKRGIAGSMVFTIFDRDALYHLKENSYVHRHDMNQTANLGDQTKKLQNVHDQAAAVNTASIMDNWSKGQRPTFIDEIPPFDITVNFLNEYGQASVMKLFGVEILNEGMGLSVDDLTSEKACTFIARNIEEMSAMDETYSYS